MLFLKLLFFQVHPSGPIVNDLPRYKIRSEFQKPVDKTFCIQFQIFYIFLRTPFEKPSLGHKHSWHPKVKSSWKLLFIFFTSFVCFFVCFHLFRGSEVTCREITLILQLPGVVEKHRFLLFKEIKDLKRFPELLLLFSPWHMSSNHKIMLWRSCSLLLMLLLSPNIIPYYWAILSLSWFLTTFPTNKELPAVLCIWLPFSSHLIWAPAPLHSTQVLLQPSPFLLFCLILLPLATIWPFLF